MDVICEWSHSDDLEDGEIRSDSEEEEVKVEPKKIVPPRPRSPKTAEQIREKIYRKMAGRKKSAASTSSGSRKAKEAPARSKIEDAKVTSSRPK